MNCYVPIRKASPRYRHYCYMDARDAYRAAGLFLKHKVTVLCHGDEWITPDGRYRWVYCRVPKKQKALFEAAMQELPDKMLLLGYDNYNEVLKEIMAVLNDGGK